MKWKPTNIPMENWGADVPEDEDLGLTLPPFEVYIPTEEDMQKLKNIIESLPPNLKPVESPNIKTIESPNLKPTETPKMIEKNRGRCYP